MNGGEVEVRHGDKVVTLDERLEAVDRDLRRLRRLILIVLVLLVVHLLRPNYDLIETILKGGGL